MGEPIQVLDQAKAALVRKLAAIVKDVDFVEKRGKNTFHGYAYQKASDLANVVRDKLSAVNIFMLSDVQSL